MEGSEKAKQGHRRSQLIRVSKGQGNSLLPPLLLLFCVPRALHSIYSLLSYIPIVAAPSTLACPFILYPLLPLSHRLLHVLSLLLLIFVPFVAIQSLLHFVTFPRNCFGLSLIITSLCNILFILTYSNLFLCSFSFLRLKLLLFSYVLSQTFLFTTLLAVIFLFLLNLFLINTKTL